MSARMEIWRCDDCKQEFSPAFVLLAAGSHAFLKFALCPTCFRNGDPRSTMARVDISEEEWEAAKAGGLEIFPPVSQK